MSAVLVTGATTPAGSAMVTHLLDLPRVTHVLAVAIEEEPAGLPESPKLTYLPVDLTRYRSVHGLLFGPVCDLGIDTIVHGALHRSLRGARRKLHALNVESTRELLFHAERHPTVRRFVYRSFAEVYQVSPNEPDLIDEDHPLDLSPEAPQRVRDRLEADITVCTHMGLSPLHIVVLRFAETLAPQSGSQLWDYLKTRVCLRPFGFDPMINLLTFEDLARAVGLALACPGQGVFNIPGADTLPLSLLIERFGCTGLPVPGPLLTPFYSVRARVFDTEFHYAMNRQRFHFGGVLDGTRAWRELGYRPEHPMRWPDMTAKTQDTF